MLVSSVDSLQLASPPSPGSARTVVKLKVLEVMVIVVEKLLEVPAHQFYHEVSDDLLRDWIAGKINW